MGQPLSGPPIRAAGGVLWRTVEAPDGSSAVEVAVIHRPRYDDWTLPKGKLAPGEAELEGAVREVLEETGHRVRVGRSLGESRYLKANGGITRPKVVRWWAMEDEGASLAVEPAPLLGVDGAAENPEGAVSLMRELGGAERDAVACSQGEVIPDLVAALAAGDGVPLPTPVRARKGSVWALTFDATSRLVAADYVAAPRPDACSEAARD